MPSETDMDRRTGKPRLECPHTSSAGPIQDGTTVRGTPKRSGLDAYGWTYERLQALVGDQVATDAMCTFLNHMLGGRITEDSVGDMSVDSAGGGMAMTGEGGAGTGDAFGGGDAFLPALPLATGLATPWAEPLLRHHRVAALRGGPRRFGKSHAVAQIVAAELVVARAARDAAKPSWVVERQLADRLVKK